MLIHIATIRTPDALTELFIDRKAELDFETDSPVELKPIDSGSAIYECVYKPLIPNLQPLTVGQRRLYASWKALGAVTELNADILFDVSVVLLETVPGPPAPDGSPTTPPWEQTAERSPRIQATAAHPRAYQGTKYKPPREKAPSEFDLRPYACDARSQESLLKRLREYWPAATVRLARAGYAAKDILALQSNEDALGVNAMRQYQFPHSFRVHFQPLMRNLSMRHALSFLSTYWALDLEQCPHLLASAAKLIHLHPHKDTIAWLRIAAGLPEEWRLTFVHALIAARAYELNPETALPDGFTVFQTVIAGPCAPYRLYCLLRALVTGVAVDYLLAGYRLADRVQEDYQFHEIRQSGFFPEQAVADLTAYFEDGGAPVEDYYRRFPLPVWKCCGVLEGLGEVIRTVDWQFYSPNVAYHYLKLYMDQAWTELPPEQLAAKWSFVLCQVSSVEELMLSVSPDYHLKCIAHLNDYFWYWDDPGTLEANMPSAYAITRRLCQPAFKRICPADWVVSDYIGYLGTSDRDRFLQAPDANFLRLEEGCRLENNAKLIGGGTLSLTRHIPTFSVDGFIDYPAKFVKTAKLLGCLGKKMRDDLAKDFSRQLIMSTGLLQLPPPELVNTLDRNRDPDVFDPVPKKLREHLSGSHILTEIPLRRWLVQLNRQITLTRLEMLEAEIARALERGLTPGSGHRHQDKTRHALQMHSLIDDNRRALRKFLRAYWSGQSDYIVTHPLTQAWLKQHPNIAPGAWLRGVQYRAESDVHGSLRLAVEQDPLEALKLGTYVGSCLGLGGICDYSAAAIVLDINKQVVYARDLRGQVVARQVVAISDDDHLVCFEVYPYTVSTAIKQMFIDFDLSFAEALGLEIYRVTRDEKYNSNERDYEIAHILSHHWWNDSAWNLKIDPVC